MNELKIGLKNKKAALLLVFGESVHTTLTSTEGLAYFSAIDPTAAELLTAVNAYRGALSMPNSAAATQTRRTRKEELINILQRIAASCELIANGNREMLVYSGFEFRKTPEHTHLPPAKPGNLRLKAGPLSGGIVAKVTRVPRADSYEMQTAADPVSGPWSASTPHTNSQSMAKTGLTPVTRVYARVRAIGANGPGEWSDIAETVVL